MRRPLSCLAAVLLLGTLSAQAAEEAAPAPRLPFSAARQAGPTLYVSGQLPRTPQGADVRGSAAAETRQVMENIGAILEAHGYSFDDVVFANVYLRDMADYGAMNAEYASFFSERFPARACVGGQEIAFDFRVEISCIAYREME